MPETKGLADLLGVSAQGRYTNQLQEAVARRFSVLAKLFRPRC